MKKYLLLLAALTAASLAYSQEKNKPDTIDARLKSIEKVLDKLPSISGFINSAYTYDNREDANTMEMRHIWLDVKGELSKKIDYRILTNFAGGLTVLDAYARFKFSKGFHLSIGQGKVPIVLENPYHPAHWETIECSMITKRYLHTAGRDIGVWACGSLFPQKDYDRFYYMAGIYNGAGINIADDNKGKDVGARIDYRPSKPITLSLSLYEGNIGDRGNGKKLNRYGAAFRYDTDRFVLRAEYMRGIGAYGTSCAERTSQGFYAVAGYHIFPELMPVLRYDYFDENIHAEGHSCINYTAGLHCPLTKFLYLKANYTYKSFHSMGEENNYNQVSASISVLF